MNVKISSSCDYDRNGVTVRRAKAVRYSVIIVFFYQLDAQILYFNTLITSLNMFRALLCSSSGGQIVLVQHMVSSLSSGDCSGHMLRKESFLNLCPEQSPKDSDDTICCTNTI